MPLVEGLEAKASDFEGSIKLPAVDIRGKQIRII